MKTNEGLATDALGRGTRPIGFDREAHRGVPGADELWKVVMRTAWRTEILVESLDVAPVDRAKVRVERHFSQSMNHPLAVIELNERTIGPDGLAIIEGP